MSEWLAMGGYAGYVWGSVLSTLAVLGWNMWAPLARRRELLRQLQDQDEAERGES